jgi:hypothetical protein
VCLAGRVTLGCLFYFFQSPHARISAIFMVFKIQALEICACITHQLAVRNYYQQAFHYTYVISITYGAHSLILSYHHQHYSVQWVSVWSMSSMAYISGLLQCAATLLDNWFLLFWTNFLPSSSRVQSSCKCQEPLNQWCSITSWKMGIFNYTAIRPLKPTHHLC